MKIEKSILALIAFVAVFVAILAEARQGDQKPRYRRVLADRDELFDDMFDEDDAMFDQQTRYVQKAPKTRWNQNGYTVRKNLGGGKGVQPAKGNWVQQKSVGEGKNGNPHRYKKPNFSGQNKAKGTKAAKGRGGRGRDEMFDNMFDEDDVMFDRLNRNDKNVDGCGPYGNAKIMMLRGN